MASTGTHMLYGNSSKSYSVPDHALRNSYLADALTAWECTEGEPISGAPLVLRFEEFDLVARAQGNELEVYLGTVNTAQPPQGAPCPAWVPSEELTGAIGQQVRRAEWLPSKSYLITFTDCSVLLRALCGYVVSKLTRASS